MVTTAVVNHDNYREDFERFLAGRQEPAVLSTLRQTALERFETLGIPTTRQEAWRFTDVSALAQTHFTLAGDAPVDATRLPPGLDPSGCRLVFVNGRYHPGLSQRDALSNGVIVSSMREALDGYADRVIAHLGQVPGLHDHTFAALNEAFMEDGAFIYLPRGKVLEAPIQLVFFTTGTNTASYPRNLLVLDDASQATIVEEYWGNGSYLSCPVTEIVLADGAALSHHKIQHEDTEAWHLGGLRLRQSRDSAFGHHLLSSGGLLARTDIAVLLDGEGADCNLNGLTLVQDKQLGDQHIRVEHAKPHCGSRQLFKGVLAGKSRTVFDGLIKVHQDAQKTHASQNNRNLLLNRQALAHSNPRLEILADDVKCSHGSTTGFLDPDALFYLRARGIGEAQARAMLVYAFANDSIETIALAPLRERLENFLIGRLYPEALER